MTVLIPAIRTYPHPDFDLCKEHQPSDSAEETRCNEFSADNPWHRRVWHGPSASAFTRSTPRNDASDIHIENSTIRCYGSLTPTTLRRIPRLFNLFGNILLHSEVARRAPVALQLRCGIRRLQSTCLATMEGRRCNKPAVGANIDLFIACT